MYTEAEVKETEKKFNDILDTAFEQAKSDEHKGYNFKSSSSWETGLLKPDMAKMTKERADTSFPREGIQALNNTMNTLPDLDFHKIVKKVYVQRHTSFKTGEGIDWAAAELMAYASLLKEGFSLRLIGEDVERGTFSHRHAVINDQSTGKPFNVLAQVVDDSESSKVKVGNSLLSEYAVLGYEYGYSISSPNSLCIWEA